MVDRKPIPNTRPMMGANAGRFVLLAFFVAVSLIVYWVAKA